MHLGVNASAGTSARALVPVGTYPDGTEIRLPVVVFRGTQPGPVVYVQAGLHGDEATGAAICRTLISRLRAPLRSGVLACVPIANPPAFLSRSRGAIHEERGPLDANRLFPGSPQSLMTERLVATLMDEFVRHAGLVIDLHSALQGCDIAPFVYLDSDTGSGTYPTRRRAAYSAGLPHIYAKEAGQQLGTSDMSRSLRVQAERIGVPAITVEMGESVRATKPLVPVGVQAVEGALMEYGLLPGVPEPSDPRVFDTVTLVHAKVGGLIRWRVDIGDPVVAGECLADLWDARGTVAEEVRSPVDGFVLRQMTLSSIGTGAEVAWIAS